jgi:V/A-type H+-transporting ATPase subunit D
MSRLNIPPTRSNLLRMKKELKFAQEGYQILDRKREVLATELMHLAHDGEILQTQVWELLAEAYHLLDLTRLTMGQEHVEWAALAINKTIDVQLRLKGVMGVPIPTVQAQGSLPEMSYSLGDTSARLDETSAAFKKVLNLIPELAELETSIWRLAVELRKAQRRVNALQYIFIPNYKDTVTFIQSELEEREREETFRIKRLKSKADRSSSSVGPAWHEYEQPNRDISYGESISDETDF